MKSTRRHELQENVLAAELGRLVEFVRKRGNYLATGLLIVALVVFGYSFLRRRAHSRQLELQHQWDIALTAQLKPEEKVSRLTALAEQRDNERIAALASVELGYEMASRALVAGNTSERNALLEKAGTWYLLTIESFPEQELAVAKAHYGMAKIRETTGQFQQAAERYRKIKAMTALKDYPVYQLAEESLRRLKAIQSPVRMVATQPASQPASRPATRPAATAPAGP